MSTFQSLPGFREFYPEDCAARNGLFRAWREAARRQGFAEYDAPVLEPLELFTEKSGEEIRTQLFEFEDKGGRKVALRPEMTPSLARLVAARAGSLRKPVKWFSIGECFRYEKPQKGRLRSFYQFNADILGEAGPGADAECIALLVESLKACGLEEGEFEIRISDRKLWFYFLKKYVEEAKIPEVLSIIDKWDREPQEVLRQKLGTYWSDAQIMQADINTFMEAAELGRTRLFEWLDGQNSSQLRDRANDLDELLESLHGLGVAQFVRFDPRIVRGLAYYTGFVFEAYQKIGTARALAGGGRYDSLIQKFGGPDVPAVGFAIGDVTVTDLLQELKRPLGDVDKPDVYLVIGGEAERKTALELAGKLRAAGLAVDYPLYQLKENQFGKQLKTANQVDARLAVILGPDEVAKGQVKIKHMKSNSEAAFANDASLIENMRNILVNGLPV
ncbi:MAG TPA: histidine--tRNA ligase [Opitutales bacterium]|jgi:histidyl-tRNA synthetase|nr:histidine--tRNA ligase [Opitutales bacterium]